MLRQCEKFGFTWLKKDIDERVAIKINAMCLALSAEPNSIGSMSIHLNPMAGLFPAMKEFELPKCEEALVSYLARVHRMNRENSQRHISRKRKPQGSSFCSCTKHISSFISEMQSIGRYRLGSLLAKKMLEEDISIFQEHS